MTTSSKVNIGITMTPALAQVTPGLTDRVRLIRSSTVDTDVL